MNYKKKKKNENVYLEVTEKIQLYIFCDVYEKRPTALIQKPVKREKMIYKIVLNHKLIG